MPQAKFFITHSWQDIDFARKLCDDLRAYGLDGFFDAYSIQPGDDIAGRIAHGLENCDVYVPLLSPAAVASKWCELEINTAINLSMEIGRDGKPRIIPVVIKPCKLPTLLRGKLHIKFDRRYKDALNELLTNGFGVTLQWSPPDADYSRGTKILHLRDRPKSSILPALTPRTWVVMSSVVIVLVLCLLGMWIAGQLDLTFMQTPTRVAQTYPTLELPTNTVVPVVLPANTPTSTSSLTLTLRPVTPTATLTLAPIVFVSAGNFSTENLPYTVFVASFSIDKFELTNAQYKRCVDDKQCTAPSSNKSSTRNFYYGNPEFDNYPVIFVSWEQAQVFCKSVGKRLPTAMEWEKAARGTDGRMYPWGDTFDGSKVNYIYSTPPVGVTTAVGSYPAGVSPYGALDMAGNVWEWVADTLGSGHIVRGGSWNNAVADQVSVKVFTSLSSSSWPTGDSQDNIGFRCAK
ncbi:Serine/threonine-protein kinase Pkn1 [Anaerolineae bacterium]|nr:Serine/threonine-protein kinase Pkn1 [Anaerolineae bacterium]